MYIENIRNVINSMTDEQYQDFLNKLRKKLKYIFDIDIKPSELKIQVEKFVTNKTDKISVRYLEAYLLTFDDLSVDGGLKVMLQGEITAATTWRDLLIILTQGQPLPRGIKIDVSDEVLIKDVKLLFKNVLKYCANDNKEIFRNNVHIVNRFLSMRKDLES